MNTNNLLAQSYTGGVVPDGPDLTDNQVFVPRFDANSDAQPDDFTPLNCGAGGRPPFLECTAGDADRLHSCDDGTFYMDSSPPSGRLGEAGCDRVSLLLLPL